MGSVGKKLDPTGGNFLGLGPGVGRLVGGVATGGLSEFGQRNPFTGIPGAVGTAYQQVSSLANNPNNNAQSAGLNLNLDPSADMAAMANLGQAQYDSTGNLIKQNIGTYKTDQANINQYGQQAYGQDQDLINQQMAQRTGARSQLANYLQNQAQQQMKMSLPQTAEDFNGGGLLNSSGYGQEVARQQANLQSGITNQLGMQGVNDINMQTQAEQQALQSLQSYQNQQLQSSMGQMDYQRQAQGSQEAALQQMQQAGLQRGFSMEDFGNQAAAAKQIGAQFAPKTGGKSGGFTGALGGLGTGAKAGAAMGNPVAGGIGGGILGALGGSGK